MRVRLFLDCEHVNDLPTVSWAKLCGRWLRRDNLTVGLLPGATANRTNPDPTASTNPSQSAGRRADRLLW
jgi:hypothetical protein